MRAATNETSYDLHMAERGTRLKFVSITKTKDENYGAALVKAPPTKENPVDINEGTL